MEQNSLENVINNLSIDLASEHFPALPSPISPNVRGCIYLISSHSRLRYKFTVNGSMKTLFYNFITLIDKHQTSVFYNSIKSLSSEKNCQLFFKEFPTIDKVCKLTIRLFC